VNAGIASAKVFSVQGNNEVVVAVDGSTSAKAGVVEAPLGVRNPLFKGTSSNRRSQSAQETPGAEGNKSEELSELHGECDMWLSVEGSFGKDRGSQWVALQGARKFQLLVRSGKDTKRWCLDERYRYQVKTVL
jgi:hypothetical protein